MFLFLGFLSAVCCVGVMVVFISTIFSHFVSTY